MDIDNRFTFARDMWFGVGKKGKSGSRVTKKNEKTKMEI